VGAENFKRRLINFREGLRYSGWNDGRFEIAARFAENEPVPVSIMRNGKSGTVLALSRSNHNYT